MNVPQLRFDGFDGEWESNTIKDLGIIGRGKSKHRPRNDARLYGTEYPFVQTSDIKHAGLYLKNYSQAYSEFGLKQSKLWPKGTLCITIAANIAETTILDIEACFPDSIIGFTPDSTKSEVVFIKKYFEFINPKLQKMSEGIAQSNLNLEKLASIEFTVPSIQEQKKIATFFTLVEKKVEKQQEKVEKLEQFKKVMMQKIFSQEFRFKDEGGGEFPEWEEAALADLGTTYTGLSGKTKEDFGHGEASFVTYVNVFNNLKASIDGLQSVDLSDGKNQNAVGQGDILFTTSSETPHEVGMASYWAFDQNNVFLNSFCFGLRLTSDLINAEFLTYLLRSPIYRAVITLLAQGSTRFNISKTGLMKMKVLIPSSEEQRKIVRVLSQIDTKLDKEQEKLMVLEEQKKGFMQGMFL
ncbi:restriction endonuclease subunit S [Planococcus sp. X10-3]|uniref:restriction endonuclease subunit S n=1 Tax=Planococcus sp. X10-3 TaxID=3061240 RepID=UPI003BAEBC5D